MNTLVLLLMTTCASGADPLPAAPLAPVPTYESAAVAAPAPARVGFFGRLRGKFSRRPAAEQYPAGSVPVTAAPVTVGEPPMTAGPVAPVITSGPAAALAPAPLPAGPAFKSAQRMPGGDPAK